MKEYKVKCSRSYSILGKAMPKIDNSVNYYIIEKSIYYPNCVIIQRIDKQKYLGNSTWIVPESEVELII